MAMHRESSEGGKVTVGPDSSKTTHLGGLGVVEGGQTTGNAPIQRPQSRRDPQRESRTRGGVEQGDGETLYARWRTLAAAAIPSLWTFLGARCQWTMVRDPRDDCPTNRSGGQPAVADWTPWWRWAATKGIFQPGIRRPIQLATLAPATGTTGAKCLPCTCSSTREGMVAKPVE